MTAGARCRSRRRLSLDGLKFYWFGQWSEIVQKNRQKGKEFKIGRQVQLFMIQPDWIQQNFGGHSVCRQR